MRTNSPCHPAARFARLVAVSIGALVLIATVGLGVAEREWGRANQPAGTSEEAFVTASIGTELAPLAAFEVLPVLFPDEFHPIDQYLSAHGRKEPGTGDWIDQYGFIRKSIAPPPTGSSDLPVGFVLSYHRPGSGAPSPVPFVGLSCAACHSTEVRLGEDTPGFVVYGAGNSTMNLLAFSEAIRRLLVKRNGDAFVLTVEAIAAARAQAGKPLTTTERVITWAWLRAARAETLEYQRVVDDPYLASQLFDPRFLPAGPNRTQPFRSLVRVHLDRPGSSAVAAEADRGFSKVPSVFHQAREFHGEWAQFDGSVRDPVARSTLAASTAGANVNNLAEPDLAANIRLAAEHTLHLAPPTWDTVFPTRTLTDDQRARAATGKSVYDAHCAHCHGWPNGSGGWNPPKAGDSTRFGTVIPISEIGTDAERVRFRHASEVATVVADEFGKNFRKDHPLATFTAADLRSLDGYYAGPIGGAFLRAPYLHNASVLTLAELIGLETRRDRFYRGRNRYDPDRVGLWSPAIPVDLNHVEPKPIDRNYYFLFDTGERGNSNRGHAYPNWAFDPAVRPTPKQTDDLKALLEYLKTL